MSNVHVREDAIRLSLEKLLEAAGRQNTVGIVVEEDVKRARAMTGAELVGHAREVADQGSMIAGCEAAVKDVRDATDALFELLPTIDHSQVAGVRAFWRMAHRVPANDQADAANAA